MTKERQLHPLDETLMHQTSRPFRFAGTSDHRFFDRHWLAMTDPDGAAGLVAGMAFYKNMGVCDGFVAIQSGSRQHNVRFSRMLEDEWTRTRCGDLEVTIVEPFRRLRLELAGDSSPMSADLRFISGYDPWCEAQYVDASTGRVGQEITRYDQCGRWTGWIDAGNGRVDVADWWGVRDHSWGVRPGVGGFDRSVADPAAQQRESPTLTRAGMIHLALFCDTGEAFIVAHRRENEAGEP
ncbi:MAG: hypothetical protein ACR2N9_05340, partial [Acidimicrobiia bacterium]